MFNENFNSDFEKENKMAINIEFKRLHSNAVVPKDGNLVATEVLQQTKNFYIVKVGFILKFEPYFRFRIISDTKNWFLETNVFDSSFSNEYIFRFRAIPSGIKRTTQNTILTYDPFPYKAGDRFAQCYFEKVLDEQWIEVKGLSTTLRGDGGFGSTGK